MGSGSECMERTGTSISCPRNCDEGRFTFRAMSREKKRAPTVRPPGAGREYAMGPVHAVFKADGDESRGRYSISEWWLEPYTRGPGAHQHEEDDVFFVIEGTMSFFVGG